MVELRETPEGIILGVRAQAAGKTNAIRGTHAGMLKVSVTVAPEQGKANDAILRVLADALQLKPRDIRLTSGATKPIKHFLLLGLSLPDAHTRIEQALEQLTK